MTIMGDLRDTAVELAESISSFFDSATNLLQDDGVKKTTTRRIRSDIAGFLEDLRSFRDDLDSTDTEASIILDTGNVTSSAWQWEHTIRQQFSLLERQLIEMQSLAERIELGIQQLSHLVKSTDTWQDIANKYYGNYRAWPIILEANNLDVSDLSPGMVLIIPELR